MQLDFAREQHRAGRLVEAEKLYRSLLLRQPGHADVLHLLGVLALQRGDQTQAVELIGKAVLQRQDDPQMYCNLAEAQRGAGALQAAETSCRRALGLRPDYPEAQLNLAAILFQQRRYADSEAAARVALGQRPDFAAATLALADALREQHELAKAEEAYRQVLAGPPPHGHAMSNLGWMLVQLGRMEEGLALCRRAATLPSDSSLPAQNLCRVLYEYGYIDEMMQTLEQALARDPNAPALSLLLGMAWEEMGEFVEARDWLGRALQLDENLSEARVQLAGLESERDNDLQAIEMLDAVLATDPARADALVGKAKAKLALGDVDGSVANYRKAIRQHPALATLHAGLGGVLSSAGDIAGAVASQRTAIALNKHCVPAYAGLLTTLRHKTSDVEHKAAVELLDATWMTDNRRANLRFGLAAYYDGAGQWDEAARQMVQANALKKAVDARRHRAYNPAQYEAYVDKTIATFTPELFRQLGPLGSDSERPVFVVGMPRSGTTLTEQIIATHPDAHGVGERPFAAQGFSLLPQVLGRTDGDPLDCLANADRSSLNVIADWHLAQLSNLDGGRALRVVDKMPDNFSMLGWLAVLFPKARFIHCRRDLRDVALSCWVTNFSAIRWANDLDHLAHRIRQYQRLMVHWRAVLPVPLLELDYEALVGDQQGQSQRLIAAVGLEWDARCLSFFETERLVRTASVTQVREPIYQRSVARWRRYENMLAPLLNKLSAPSDGFSAPKLAS